MWPLESWDSLQSHQQLQLKIYYQEVTSNSLFLPPPTWSTFPMILFTLKPPFFQFSIYIKICFLKKKRKYEII